MESLLCRNGVLLPLLWSGPVSLCISKQTLCVFLCVWATSVAEIWAFVLLVIHHSLAQWIALTGAQLCGPFPPTDLLWMSAGGILICCPLQNKRLQMQAFKCQIVTWWSASWVNKEAFFITRTFRRAYLENTYVTLQSISIQITKSSVLGFLSGPL